MKLKLKVIFKKFYNSGWGYEVTGFPVPHDRTIHSTFGFKTKKDAAKNYKNYLKQEQRLWKNIT